ncbi:MAG: MATE family efflux transporter [Oscillospiraceae bacterium]|nr:MATE family efflux transporter [Oscillospiraceae bacterium]MBR6207998.1 MATE family efflux transporter [Oscillospiraceae bacterium]
MKLFEVASSDRMETAPIVPLILSMSTPVMVMLLTQALYTFVDSIYVTRLSSQAFTAVSLVIPLQSFVTAVSCGTGVGVNVLMSTAFGKKRADDAFAIAIHGLLLAVLDWLLFLILSFFALDAFFDIYAVSNEVRALGTEYIRILVWASLFVFVSTVCSRILQSTGNMSFPMLFELIGAVVNIVLDPIMIFGLFGFPRLGITGAAIATATGQLCTMLLMLYMLIRRRDLLPHRASVLKASFSTIKDICVFGFPTMIMYSMCTFYIAGLNAVAVHFSEAAVSAIGIYYKLQSFLLVPTNGLNQGITPLLGYNYGSGNYLRLWRTLFVSTVISFLSLCTGTLCFWLFTRNLLEMFSPTAELLSVGIPALRIISTSFPFFVFTILNPTLFQATGHIKENVFVTIVRQIICLVPLAVIFSRFGLTYMWLTFPVSELIAAVLALWYTYKLYTGVLQIKEEAVSPFYNKRIRDVGRF